VAEVIMQESEFAFIVHYNGLRSTIFRGLKDNFEFIYARQLFSNLGVQAFVICCSDCVEVRKLKAKILRRSYFLHFALHLSFCRYN